MAVADCQFKAGVFPSGLLQIMRHPGQGGRKLVAAGGHLTNRPRAQAYHLNQTWSMALGAPFLLAWLRGLLGFERAAVVFLRTV